MCVIFEELSLYYVVYSRYMCLMVTQCLITWGISWAFSLVCGLINPVFGLGLAVMVLACLRCDLLHMAAWDSHLSQLDAACLKSKSSSGGMFWAALAACVQQPVFRLALFTPQRTMFKGRDSDPQSFTCRKLDIKLIMDARLNYWNMSMWPYIIKKCFICKEQKSWHYV